MKILLDELRLKLPVALPAFFALADVWLIEHVSPRGKLVVAIQPSAFGAVKKAQPVRNHLLLTAHA
jgi:hypothetical protein